MARNERSAGFVIVARRSQHPGPEAREFLLLDYGRHWDFPKGHVDKGEEDLAAAVRELREETGIADARILADFQHEITYFFRDRKKGLIRKTVVFFLAEVAGRDVTLSHEHVGYVFLGYEEALRNVTYPSAKAVLRAAHEHLSRDVRVPR